MFSEAVCIAVAPESVENKGKVIMLRDYGRKLKKFGYYKAALEAKVSQLRGAIIEDLEASVKEGRVDLTKELPLFLDMNEFR